MDANMKMIRLRSRAGSPFMWGICGLLLLGVAGCSSLPSVRMPSLSLTSPPLQPDIVANPAPGQIVHARRPIVLHVARYIAAGPVATSGKIGDISAGVNDMLGSELHVQDVSGTVTAAMAKQLSASGFQTVVSGGKAAAGSTDFEISGVIKEFSMNIAGRDEVSIVVETTLRDGRNSGILWSGVVTEKADRFAGVTGNTRSSITRYLSDALAKVSAKTRDAISESIMQTYPELFQQAASVRQSAPGVTVLVAPPQQAPASQFVGPGITGQLTIATTPSRARVYVADVYYGLSPLKLELEPGIYTLHVKLDGFKTATEKVSVRKRETTELELRLQGPP